MDAGLLAETYSVEARMARQSNSQTHSHHKFEKISSDQPFWRPDNEGSPTVTRAQRKRSPQPGMKHSVEWWGKGRGVSRIMRKAGQKTGAQNPHTRGGRRAHGPKVEKEWTKDQLQREEDSPRLRDCRIMRPHTVSSRGHRFEEGIRFPSSSTITSNPGKSDEKYDIESIPTSTRPESSSP